MTEADLKNLIDYIDRMGAFTDAEMEAIATIRARIVEEINGISPPVNDPSWPKKPSTEKV